MFFSLNTLVGNEDYAVLQKWPLESPIYGMYILLKQLFFKNKLHTNFHSR